MTKDVKLEFDLLAFEKSILEICKKDVTFTEAILIWLEDNNVEIELISSIIKKNAGLKSRIEEDARKRNLLKK